jgi:hypothetical protein
LIQPNAALKKHQDANAHDDLRRHHRRVDRTSENALPKKVEALQRQRGQRADDCGDEGRDERDRQRVARCLHHIAVAEQLAIPVERAARPLVDHTLKDDIGARGVERKDDQHHDRRVEKKVDQKRRQMVSQGDRFAFCFCCSSGCDLLSQPKRRV